MKGQLSRTATQDAGILTISEATSGDSGLYDCVARDADGQEVFESARVNIDAFEALPTAAISPERYISHIVNSTKYNNLKDDEIFRFLFSI